MLEMNFKSVVLFVTNYLFHFQVNIIQNIIYIFTSIFENATKSDLQNVFIHTNMSNWTKSNFVRDITWQRQDLTCEKQEHALEEPEFDTEFSRFSAGFSEGRPWTDHLIVNLG